MFYIGLGFKKIDFSEERFGTNSVYKENYLDQQEHHIEIVTLHHYRKISLLYC